MSLRSRPVFNDTSMMGDAGPLSREEPFFLPEGWKRYEHRVIMIGASHMPSVFPVYLERVDLDGDILMVRAVHIRDTNSEGTLASPVGDAHPLQRRACYFVVEVPTVLH